MVFATMGKAANIKAFSSAFYAAGHYPALHKYLLAVAAASTREGKSTRNFSSGPGKRLNGAETSQDVRTVIFDIDSNPPPAASSASPLHRW